MLVLAQKLNAQLSAAALVLVFCPYAYGYLPIAFAMLVIVALNLSNAPKHWSKWHTLGVVAWACGLSFAGLLIDVRHLVLGTISPVEYIGGPLVSIIGLFAVVLLGRNVLHKHIDVSEREALLAFTPVVGPIIWANRKRLAWREARLAKALANS